MEKIPPEKSRGGLPFTSYDYVHHLVSGQLLGLGRGLGRGLGSGFFFPGIFSVFYYKTEKKPWQGFFSVLLFCSRNGEKNMSGGFSSGGFLWEWFSGRGFAGGFSVFFSGGIFSGGFSSNHANIIHIVLACFD